LEGPSVEFEVDGIYSGKIGILAQIQGEKPRTLKSAIHKHPLQVTQVTTLGFEGDEHATNFIHGGADRAILHYDALNYPKIHRLFPAIPSDKCTPPHFGENISTSDPQINETTICIGDIFTVSDSTLLLEVSQPRKPCYKLNHQFQTESFAETMQKRSLTGWFYRVLRAGSLAPGSRLHLQRRPYPELTIDHVWGIYTRTSLSEKQLTQLSECPALESSWKDAIQKRRKTKKLPDEKGRLQGASNKFIKS